jgi:Fe-S-cluster containining protein/histone H3/H4
MLPQKPPANEKVFACQLCGECCSSWQIPVEAHKATHLLAQPWVTERLADLDRSLEPLDADTWRIPLRPDNYCIFLAEDKRCLIEVNEGREWKPEQCKRFPFAAVRMPDGVIRHEVSAACKSIAEKHLIPFVETLPSSHSEPVTPENLPVRIKRSPFRTLSADAYEAYQEQVAEILQDTSCSLSTSLFRVYQVLRCWPQPPKELADAFSFHSRWERLFPVRFIRRPYGAYSAWQIWREGTYLDQKIFGVPLDLAGHGGVLIPDEVLDPPLRGFLYQLLRRRVLLSYGHHLMGQLLLAGVAYHLVRWYARTLALVMDRDTVTESDVVLAIRVTERYYTGHQPAFLEWFRTSPAVSLWTALLFQG